MRTRSQTKALPSTGLLDLPPELRIRILEHLFSSYIPDEDSADEDHENPSTNDHYLETFNFYIDRAHITKHRTARGYAIKPPPLRKKYRYTGVFLTCKTLRHEALDVWYGLVKFKFQEHSRWARLVQDQIIRPRQAGRERTFGRADPIAILNNSSNEPAEGFLARVRNCEVRFEVETEWELRQLPSRFSLLMQNLNMSKMKTFKIVIEFVKTHGPKSGYGFGRRVLKARAEQKAVSAETWRVLREDLERLELGRWRGHLVRVWRTWEKVEGWEVFESLGRVIGAEVGRFG